MVRTRAASTGICASCALASPDRQAHGGTDEIDRLDVVDDSAAAGGWLAATMFAQPATSKEPRFPQLTMDQLSEAQKPLGEQVMKVSSVGLGGPYNPLMRSPVLGQRLFDLFHYLRWETSVRPSSTNSRS